ncbi:MAG TPA: alpha/beta fold hydrolase [Gallionellaceae bacterium]|nr:alpha/beta fold hydrolase [Gallionellaceae bacterium]
MRLLFPLVLAISLSACTNVFFQPQQIQYLTPDQIGLAYEDVYFNSSDGVRLHGWLLPAQGKAKGTILFLHGNAENITTHIASVYWLPAQHYNVFLPDYRGYGRSEGSPSLEGAQEDINSAMSHLLQRSDIDHERIVMLGQSLGGALAIYNTAHSPYRSKIKALITESAFSDYRSIAREKLDSFWLSWPLQWPLSLTIDNDYSPLPVVNKISPIPLLIIHGDKDKVVPLAHGQALYAAAAQPKEMWVVEGGGHIAAFRRKEYQIKLLAYLQDILKN